MPREQWKGFVPPYKPVFMDGWSPALMDDYGTAASNGGGRGKYEGEEAALQDHSDSEQEQRMYRHTGHHQDHTQDRRYGDTIQCWHRCTKNLFKLAFLSAKIFIEGLKGSMF